jgi:transcriptional repressor NrdR
MRCPFCEHPDTQVVETRESDEGGSIRRRRRCLHCDKRFTTYERAELQFPTVVKRSGLRAEFDRDKLRASIALALRKRPVAAADVDAAVQRIEEWLRGLGVREVPSERIGETVMTELRKLDKVGYVRFASVYRSFEDVNDFADAIREVRPPDTPRGA